MATTCTVIVRRATWPHIRHRAGRRPSPERAHVAGTVDGFTVRATQGKGWSCACSDDECDHVDRLAAHIDPELLAIIDKESDPDD